MVDCDGNVYTPLDGQHLMFGCIDHQTTKCTYSPNNAGLDGVPGFNAAIAAFDACANECCNNDCFAVPCTGYCQVKLTQAANLHNQGACRGTDSGGASPPNT